MTVAAVFLDRDGVINVDSGYVGAWDSFVFLPGVIEAMRTLCESGYALVVVTNQSGIGRGFYTEEDFHILTNMASRLRASIFVLICRRRRWFIIGRLVIVESLSPG